VYFNGQWSMSAMAMVRQPSGLVSQLFAPGPSLPARPFPSTDEVIFPEANFWLGTVSGLLVKRKWRFAQTCEHVD